jgi:hypothetical protein
VQNGDNITASYATVANAASNVGTYAITASLNDPDGKLVNYTVSNTPGALTVTAAALSVSADNQTKVYGAANPALTGTITGLKNSDNITATYATVANAGSSVGTYPITVTLNDPSSKLGNYAMTSTAGTLTITTAPLSVAVDNQSKVYGSANPVFTGTLTGLVNGDDITATYATIATASSAAGSYPITATLSDPDNRLSNYNVISVNGTLTVTPAALTISADNQSRLYGATNPVFTASYAGLVNGDTASSLSGTLTVTTAADTNSPVGTYPIVASGLSSGNYATTFANGTLTITAAPLLVSANNASRVYGAANPAFSASVTGLVNGEATNVLEGALVFNTSATTNSPVGTYPIAVSGVTASNYDITFTNGTLTVTAYALSVVADNQSRVYGSANPAFTGTLSGVRNGDHITASYSSPANVSSPIGSYAINASLNDPDGKLINYTVSNVTGTLSVTSAPLSVSVNNQSKVYGSTNPALTGAISGLRNGDNITAFYTTTASTSTPIGNYPITATLNDPSNRLANYTVTMSNGVFTITRAVLFVSADSKSRIYGTANPALTATISGYVNGDSAGVVSGSPSLSAAAANNSSVGSYQITAGIGSLSATNYRFQTTNGVLTIQAAHSSVQLVSSQNPATAGASVNITATILPEAPSTGTPNGSVQFLVNGAAQGGPVNLSSGQATFTSQSLPPGTNTITATYSGEPNFSGSGTNLQQIIQPATAASVQLAIQLNANGTVTISFTGEPGAQYAIQAVNSLNSATWSTLATQTADGAGHVVYTDQAAISFASRFYRTAKQAAVAPPGNASVQSNPNGTVTISFSGTPGAQYLVQAADMIAGSTWTTIATLVADATGQVSYTDSNPGNTSSRFYRGAKP